MTRTPLTTSLDGYEVWFLTGSQHLYGPETLRQVAEQSRAIADSPSGSATELSGVATPDDAREILSLKGGDNVAF